jgi:glutathione synthase/RimK-type ligase-like ATP-grasp enzyme
MDALDGVAKRFIYSHKDPFQALRDAIKAVKPDLIVPCDDRAILHLQQLHALETGCRQQHDGKQSDIARLIERSLGNPEGFATTRSRYPLISAARSVGLPAPEAARLRTTKDLDQWLSRHGFPTVLKVDGSWGGNGVFVVRSREEAHQVFKKLSRHIPYFLALKRRVVNRDPYWMLEARLRVPGVVSAQTFVEGSPANCAMFCWEGRVLAGIAVEVLQAQNSKAPATVVRVVDSPEMMDAASLLAARLGLSGFFGLDFMVDAKTGTPQLIEMNARPTPLCHFRLGPGRDLVGALAATLYGRPLAAKTDTSSNVIAYFPDASRVSGNEIPAEAFHDIPHEAPALIEELLRRPWPNRSVLARTFEWWVGFVMSGIQLAKRPVPRERRTPCVAELPERTSGTPAMAHVKID